MSKYTAEQVKAAAESILNSPGLEACDMGVEASMLRAYAEMLREHEQKEVMRNGGDGVSTVPAVTGGAHRNNAQVVEKVAKAIAPCSWDDLDSFEIAAYTMRAIMAIDAYEAAKPAAQGEVVAWASIDGRVIDAKAKAAGERAGGATKSALSTYSIPLTPQPPAVDEAADQAAKETR